MKVKVAAFILTPLYCLGAVLCISTYIISYGLHRPPVENYPDMQVGSQWESKDGRIEFNTENDGKITGIIHTSSGVINVDVYTCPGAIYIYPLNKSKTGDTSNSQNTELEYWYANYRRANRVKVEVVESTYFTPGEKFTIYRTVKGISDEEYLKLYNSGD